MKKITIPKQLKSYIVPQNYKKYSSENQKTWRYILRQLKSFLSEHAHPLYLEGLEKTGITINRIPRISAIDQKLQKLGWRAVPVSGFIPPAVFMEFQYHNILPIASDIRTIQHINYTPAPDIVHEAAGHAPFLIHPVFNSFLKKYAQVIKKAIPNKEDYEQYSAIRQLSDIKEHPHSTPQQIRAAQNRLKNINKQLKKPSEASLLSRFIWWTSEYGLIGNLKKQKIYGAGLLSSIGEAQQCLTSKIKKLPLDLSCIEYSYDITDYQPQLFVTPNFETLHDLLIDLKKQCAFYIGGEHGLFKAQKSRLICTIELDTGLQISGLLENFISANSQSNSNSNSDSKSNNSAHSLSTNHYTNQKNQKIVDFIKLTGPCQLSYKNREINHHGKDTHNQGYSSPLGDLKNQTCPLSCMSINEIKHRYRDKTNRIKLEFKSGWTVEGRHRGQVIKDNKILILQFQNCYVKRGDTLYFKPEWGDFDLAIGEKVCSVFGGPADQVAFGDLKTFYKKPSI